MHYTANLPPLQTPKKFNFWSEKPIVCFSKNTISVSYEKSYSLCYILRQICNNLEIKGFQWSEPSKIGQFNSGRYELAGRRLKNVGFECFERMIFLPFPQYGQK